MYILAVCSSKKLTVVRHNGKTLDEVVVGIVNINVAQLLEPGKKRPGSHVQPRSSWPRMKQVGQGDMSQELQEGS